jgi:hypothetical protein
MLNPFFHNNSKVEQGLIQDLINESIKIYGVDVFYLPRFYLTKKTVIREVIESEFKNAYPIEAYVDTYDGYEGAGTLMSKFGIQPMNDLTITISRERFEDYISPLIKRLPNVELSTRPKEGDLIYFPLGDRIFEIKFVEHEQPFYQLGKTYIYKLNCELFRYQNEVINTGNDIIDQNVSNEGFIQTYIMVGSGSYASATANVVNGGVRFVTMLDRGYGYTSAPTVTFGTAPTGGQTATGTAEMLGGIVDLCGPDPDKLRVQAVNLTNSGFGYTVAPSVSFTGGGGSGTDAIATIGDGVIGSINLLNGGSGYVGNVTVSIVGLSSMAASAKAVIQNGTITSIQLTNSGYGYSQSPQIIISDPVFIGIGTYKYNEVVTGSATSFTARVRAWDSITKTLQLAIPTGTFVQDEVLTGQESGATYKVEIPSYGDNLTDKYADNLDIQEESNDIIDFSVKNPFGIF